MQQESEEQFNGGRERVPSLVMCRKWRKGNAGHRHLCWKAKDHPGPHECSCWEEWMDR